MKTPISGIYRLVSPSGKSYIGQSKHINKRINDHKRKTKKNPSQTKLFYALKKYGFENFSVEILEICDISELDDREKFWIKEYNSVHNGYNCDFGGQQTKIFGKEHREKLRMINLGKYSLKDTEIDQRMPFFLDGVKHMSIGDAHKATGIPPKTIHNRLNSPNPKYSNYLYEKEELRPIRKIKPHPACKSIVINGIVYDSITEATKFVDVCKNTLMKYLKDGKLGFSYTETLAESGAKD
jgi:group I intron endonuclease